MKPGVERCGRTHSCRGELVRAGHSSGARGTRSGSHPWNARLLLAWGVAEAWLGLQSGALRERWQQLPREYLATFLHGPGVGADHPSRAFVASCIRVGESVLDVGGPGVNYEVLLARDRASRYVGVVLVGAVDRAGQGAVSGGDHPCRGALALISQFGPSTVDVVVVRHVLEHLPDFEAAWSRRSRSPGGWRSSCSS